MEQEQTDNSSAQTSEVPEVKPKHAGGRKPKGYHERGVQEVLDGSATKAAQILKDHMNQAAGHKKIKDSVMKIAFYIIDHTIGKARIKVEHSGGVLSYSEIAKSAEDLLKKPPPVLVDAEKIAQDYQDKDTNTGDNEPANPTP